MRIPLGDAHIAYVEELRHAADAPPRRDPAPLSETMLDRCRSLARRAWKIIVPIAAAIVAHVTSLNAAVVPEPVPLAATLRTHPWSLAPGLVAGDGYAAASPQPHAPGPSSVLWHPVAYMPRGPWIDGNGKPRKRHVDRRSPGLGVATHTGKVRTRNEDAGAALHLGDVSVALLADGVGGEPFGDVASLCAIEAALSALGDIDGAALAGSGSEALGRLRIAFAAAELALAGRAAELGISAGKPGLRTTLLIALASRDRIAFGQIGDGAMMLLRDGAVLPLITAHKADPERLSVLAACLGPATLGEPVFGALERRPGDVLIAATDGISDRVTEAFYARTAVEQIVARGGDLEGAAADLLESLAAYRLGGEAVFDDNMTLALFAETGTPAREHEDGAPHEETRP